MTAPAPAVPPLVEGDMVRFADELCPPGYAHWRGRVRAITSKGAYVRWDVADPENCAISGPLAWFVRATD
jgi:hypothetical protein